MVTEEAYVHHLRRVTMTRVGRTAEDNRSEILTGLNRLYGDAWRADLWGRRILAWTCHAPLILSSGDLIYRSKVLNALARGARHLDRGADKAVPGANRVAAWCGVVMAGLLIPGGDPRRAFGEAGLARALDGQAETDIQGETA